MTEPLTVLYEDAHVVAVAKPSGLLTQGISPGEPTLEQSVRRHLSPTAPESVYLGTVHRLDRPVSGVVLWAKTPKAARRLAAQFAARETVKEYWGVVEAAAGLPTAGAEGVWDDLLARSADAAGVVRAAGPGTPGARRAVTRYRVASGAGLPEGTVWLRLWPETGRTHQIRAQAALHGLPLLGDLAYGAARAFAPGVALHARALGFEHPTLRRPVTVTAPLPASWRGEGVGLPEDGSAAG